MKDVINEGRFQSARSEIAFKIVDLLKLCAKQKDICKGSKLHAYICERKILEEDPYVASTLVSMYARCGALSKAQKVLNNLVVRDVITWTALIAGYSQQGHGVEALNCFDAMECEGHSPNAVTFTCALNACGSIGAAAKGEEIHDKIVFLGLLQKDVVLGNALIDMYAKCGALAKAQQVFNELPVRNMITWNTLIGGYVQQRQPVKALECFDRMQCEGYFPNGVTFTFALKACGILRAAAKGEKIHEKLVSLGLLEKDIMLGNTLIDMYARSDALAKARQAMKNLLVRDVVTWTALIAGYVQQGQGDEALKCFDSMELEGLSANAVTFTCALKACGSIGAIVKGEMIHEKIVKLGMLEKNIVLASTLVDMYAKCGALAKAQQVLYELPIRNVVTWNALIAGYAQQGPGEEALKCFDSMQCEGHSPDGVTFICALKACGSIRLATKGEAIHDKIVSMGMLDTDLVLGNTLVDMYAKCGALTKAQQVLGELPVHDAVTWNALMGGYVEQGLAEEALKCFDSMQHEGHSPNAFTFTYALKACGSLGLAIKGKKIHDKTASCSDLLQEHLVLANTLVDMYARCGSLAKAQEVLEGLPVQNVIEWTTLLAGYAEQGQSVEALNCFERMQSKGFKPDSTTLICMLNACSHSGVLDLAEMLFSQMLIKYGSERNKEHYGCMVDLFGRVGQFNKALVLIENVPFTECLSVWLALLGSCHKWGDVNIGGHAFKHAFHLDKSAAGAYVCMANIYSAACLVEDVGKFEVMRVAKMLVD